MPNSGIIKKSEYGRLWKGFMGIRYGYIMIISDIYCLMKMLYVTHLHEMSHMSQFENSE